MVGEKLAHVLSGGRLTGTQKVSEQYLLDLEREAFLSLCGNAETQAAHAVHAEELASRCGIEIRSHNKGKSNA